MVVMTSAPGAIVDFRADGAPVSAVISGLEEWDSSFKPEGLRNPQKISEPRLERDMRVRGFRLPPVVDEDWKDASGQPDNRAIHAVRFPEWLQCPKCDRIAPADRWKLDPGRAYRYCPKCTQESPGKKPVFVIPVRFVMACEAGHLDDFPWHSWVKHKPDCTNTNGFLELKSTGPGLAGLVVRCPECKKSQSLDGIFSAATWEGFTCKGKRPWLAGPNQICDKQPRALQRGASNMYFPVIESALSIPPWSDRLQEAVGTYWSPIARASDEDRHLRIQLLAKDELKSALEDLNLTVEEFTNLIEERIKTLNSSTNPDLRAEEYRQFISGVDTRPEDEPEFELRNVPLADFLPQYFSRLGRVVRLREVRAIRGFTRINPPEDKDDKLIAKLSVKTPDWYPAIEVRGEGIFLALHTKKLAEWEQQEEIRKRADQVNFSFQKEWRERYDGAVPKRSITARFLLVHTFAHALMRQLTLECGYSSAALRERLYVSEGDDGMAGLLIYTSTSDSDGTLGGLQRQGESSRMIPTVRAAIKAMEWCSSDPLCINGMASSMESSHSLAACHACCLAPENACEEFNRFLDRAMLIGLPDKSAVGYFSPLLREV